MKTQSLLEQTLVIPTYGMCTLLNLATLPPDMCTYANIRATARTYGLTELGVPNHNKLQIIAKTLAHHLKGLDSCIWISGVLRAYPQIEHENPHQEMKKCVLGLVLSTWPGQQESLDPWFEYVPIHQVRDTGDRRGFCLFRGGE